MKKISEAVLAAAAAAALMTAAPAAQAQNIQVGTLTCSVAPGAGFVVGSRKQIACTFQNAAAKLEVYDGSITKIGVDIGFTDGAVIVWNVLAPSGRYAVGALNGNYIGATAEATVGGGVGANALIGGFNRSITLQPLSISTQTGVNIAAGAAEMTLALRPPQRRR